MSRKNKHKVLENVTITDIAAEGLGFLRLDGKVIFAEQSVPGDVVDLLITKSRNDYAMGSPVQMHQPSPLRVAPFCEHFGTCGGCTWQNVSYSTQLQFKKQIVEDAFRRIAKLTEPGILPVLPAAFDKYYRNKLEYTFSLSGWISGDFSKDIDKKPALGFHVRKQFANVFDVKHCYLQPAPSNEIRLAVRAFALQHALPFYDIRNSNGYLRNIVIRTTATNDLMVILIVGENKPDWLFPLLDHIKNTFPEITSLFYVVNTKLNDHWQDMETVLYSGKDHIVERIGNIQYRLGPKSFFQTNTQQAENLYRIALEYAELKKEDIVYDLYTGLGSIALLAAGSCEKITGIELIEAAIEDAKINAELNAITNAEFVCGDMSKMFNDDFIARYGKANVVITDPPRAGMHKNVCMTLLNLAPEKIVYVSCNPATQARDIWLLSEKYTVVKLQPVDMFPQTYHIENIALLHKKDQNSSQ